MLFMVLYLFICAVVFYLVGLAILVCVFAFLGKSVRGVVDMLKWPFGKIKKRLDHRNKEV